MLPKPILAGALALAVGAATATAYVAPAPAPPKSDRLPSFELEDFHQTEASSFADYAGRAVLFEFFEHW